MSQEYTIEDEQEALIYYLQNADPGPILRQMAEDRIRALEINKRNGKSIPIKPIVSKESNFYLRNNITIL